MHKRSFNKIFLMIITFSLLIIIGGCGGGGGGDPYSPQPPTPPQPGSPTLTGLQLSSGSLDPAFSPTTTQYTVNVADTVTSVTVTATVASANASISVNGLNVSSGNASGAMNLNAGSNTIAIIVENSAGSTTYTITVIRASQPGYRRITAREAYAMMAQSSNYILLDVRTEAEFKEERISGSILLPYDEIENRAATELPDKTKLIFVYCQRGIRSEIATRALVGLGYSNVYDFGGILDWPYATIGDPPLYWADAADISWWNAAGRSFNISTAEQFAGVAKLINQGMTNFSGVTITLANNINLAGRNWEQMTGAIFQGVLDGGGYAISNIKIFSYMPDIGLFGTLGSSGTVKNVNLANVDITICPT